MQILKFLFTSITLSICQLCFSQTAADTYKYALELFHSGNFEQSAVEVERVVLLSDAFDQAGYLILAECYANQSHVNESAEYYTKASELETSDSVKLEIQFKKFLLYIKNNQPIYALTALNTMHVEQSEYFTKKKLFYLVSCHFLLDNFRESEDYLISLSKFYPGYDSSYVASIFIYAKRNKSVRTSLFSFMSAVLPGSGQFANGSYQKGVDSFILNAVLIGAAIITINRLSFLDAFLSLYPVTKRYYLSGISKSKALAEQKKENRKIDLYNKLLDYEAKYLID